MSIPSELYRTFYQVAQAGSVSLAARQLFITQPAVSRSIRQLEDAIGCKLFFRMSKGVTLTKQGVLLLHYVEQAFTLLSLGEKKLAQLQNLETGELSIGVGDTICRHYLVPHLQVFRQHYPGVRIHITNQKTYEITAMLKRGDIDMGIGNLPFNDEQIRTRPVMAVHDIFVAGPKYHHLAASPLHLDELAEYPLMLVEKGSHSRAVVDAFWHSHGVVLHPDFELGNFELLAQFAAADFGLACIIREFFRQELDNGSLVELTLAQPMPTRHIGVFSLIGIPLSAAAAALVFILMEHDWPQQAIEGEKNG